MLDFAPLSSERECCFIINFTALHQSISLSARQIKYISKGTPSVIVVVRPCPALSYALNTASATPIAFFLYCCLRDVCEKTHKHYISVYRAKHLTLYEGRKARS